jgi:hypothetical protein
MPNKSSQQKSDDPFSFFGPIVSANQGAAAFGQLAGKPAMDGFMVIVAPSSAVTLTDQNGAATVFPNTAFVLGQIYALSPSAFTNIGTAGQFVPLYK